MPEPGRHHSLPAPYRILLALSLALFLHSLLVAALALHLSLPEPEQPVRVELTLVASGSPEATSTRPSQPARATRAAQPAEDKEVPAPVPKPLAGTSEPLMPAPQPEPESPSPRQATASNAPQAASTASHQRQQGQSSPTSGDDTALTSEIPRKSGENTSGYQQELARRISAEMGQQGVVLPKAPQRQQLAPVELELRLMTNGALVDAKVTRSSGFADLDRSALKAALRASPYPEPPASDQSGGWRYRIEFYLESAPPG